MNKSHFTWQGGLHAAPANWLSAMCLVFLCTKVSFTQNISTLMGARSMGVGNASSSLADEWSMWNNPSGMATLSEPALSFSFERRHSLRGTDRLAAGGVVQTPIGCAGAGYFQFGDQLYSEQLLMVAFAHKIGITSVGARCDVIQYRAEGFTTSHSVGVTLGLISLISPQLAVAVYATNINQPQHSSGERLPIKMAVGLCLKPLDNVSILTELEKDLAFDPTVKGGLEYCAHKKFRLRTGFNLFPHAAFFGWGARAWRLQIDYSVRYSFDMGYSQQASLAMALKRKSGRGHGRA